MCGGRPKAAAAAAAESGGRRPFSQPLGNPNRELNSGPPRKKTELKNNNGTYML